MLRNHHNPIFAGKTSRWSETDLLEVTKYYPDLRIVGNSLVGHLEAKTVMVKGSPVFTPDDTDFEQCELASALFFEFEVQIGIDPSSKRPELRLMECRYEQTAERLGWSLSDLHIYDDRRTCYCAPQVFENLQDSNISAIEFVNRFVLPFLYWQAYVEKHGKAPWRDLAHGALGALEWLGSKLEPSSSDLRQTENTLFKSDQLLLLIAFMTKRPRWYHACPCGKPKRFGECHPTALVGILAIRSAASQGKLQRTAVFVKNVKQKIEKDNRQATARAA